MHTNTTSHTLHYPPTPAFAKAGAAPGTTAGVELVFLSNRHPKATSMASYGRPAQAIGKARSIASSRRSSVPFARHSQPTGIPRPHQWLLMGVQTFSRRSSVPFTRHSQPTGIPRPHQWLLMGVQACRLPAPKPLKPSKPLKPLKLSKLCKSVSGQIHCFFWAVQRAVRQAFASQQASQGHINGYYGRPSLPLVQRAVRRAVAANRHPKATSMASYGRPSLPFASP